MAGPTEKQKEARKRNHRIFRLRGLWYNVGFSAAAQFMRELIDAELLDLGAEPECQRREAQRARHLTGDFS